MLATGAVLIAAAIATVLVMDWFITGWRRLLVEQARADNERVSARQVQTGEDPHHGGGR